MKHDRQACELGSHRVLEPLGALPQNAWRLDATAAAGPREILCDVEALNIDSASFRQIAEVCAYDPERIAAHILATVAERGKQHNAVTGSGGMFVGRVRAVGAELAGDCALAPGDRIASLVSLTLTPLAIEAIECVDLASGRLRVRGTAVLFASGLWARLPDDFDDDVTLAILDVAGAPAQVHRLAQPGATVAVFGADGKSGILACVAARERVGPQGRVIGLGPDAETVAARLLVEHGYVDAFLACDAQQTLATRAAWRAALGEDTLADVAVSCVNVPGTELATILLTREGGTVYFFSMATSFTAAALGAEGVGKDVTMVVGNGYARDHACFALQLVRDHPPLRTYFTARYAPLAAALPAIP